MVSVFVKVQTPAGVKPAPGTRSHVAPGWQLLRPGGTIAAGSHVSAQSGRESARLKARVSAQLVRMQAGWARMGLPFASGGAAHEHSISEPAHTQLRATIQYNLGTAQTICCFQSGGSPGEHGALLEGSGTPDPCSCLHSPAQYAHFPVLLFIILQGHGLPPSGWQGQLSQVSSSAVAQGRAQKAPLTPWITTPIPL